MSDQTRRPKDGLTPAMDEMQRPSEENTTLADEAEAAVDAQRNQTAEALQSFADSIQEKTATMPGGDTTSEAGAVAAERIEHAADYVHERNPRRIAGDLKALVRQQPVLAVGAGIAVGFVIGRLSK